VNTTLCSPTSVLGLNAAATKVIQSDNAGCALLIDRTIQCWGNNDYGELGNGTGDDSDVAALPVVGISNAIDLALGFEHGCAVLATGSVECWGDDSVGELGDGQTNTQSNVPVAVVGLDGPAIAVTADVTNSCALLANGEVECWGLDESGSLGDNASPLNALSPTSIIPSGVISISQQVNLGCALYSGGNAKCWGLRDAVDDAGSLKPVDVLGLP
jgi:alpha-tubulin suppressor-like RCC1 family protein